MEEIAVEEATTLETTRAPWWLQLLGGILSIIVGILLLTSPARSVFVLVFALGIYWLISGVFTLIGMFIDHTAWGWKLFMGILSIIAGIVVMRNPLIASVTVPAVLLLFLGIQGLIVGIVSIVMAFKGGGWGAGILGLLSVVFGIIIMLNWASLGAIAAYVWVVGILAIVGGIVQIFFAFTQRGD
jgi:uncharacterized membrane protein HdeD (DUF308 family)